MINKYKDMELALRVLAMPKDANPLGDIFGGWIMAQVDIAGAVIASQEVKCRVVTIAVTEFLFKQPVSVGDLISCFGKVTKIGKTSITVFIEVFVRRGDDEKPDIKVTEATLVYVAVDENCNPKTIARSDLE